MGVRRAQAPWRRRVEREAMVQAAWRSRWLRVRVRVRVSRKRPGAEAGRMLRCAWVRLSTTQVRSRRLMEAWRRHRRGAGSVVQQQVA